MSNTIKKFVVAGAFLVLLPAAVLAVPQVINYQGRLTDGAGFPVTGDRPIVLSLYTTASGGTTLWSEGRTVTVTDGMFSVLLGSVSPVPEAVFQSDAVYLGVKVDSDAEMTPRARLTSVGYAYMANGVNITSTGSDAPVFVNMSGISSAAVFSISNSANSSPTVAGVTNGMGNAGYFLVSNTGSTAPAVYANTLGTGPAGQFDGDVQVNGALSAASLSGNGAGLLNVKPTTHKHAGTDITSTVANATHATSADNATHAASADDALYASGADDADHADWADTSLSADNAALLNGMTSANIIDAASDEVRMPISAVPFTIASPGSYYFTDNLTCTSTTANAITVGASDVTIDIMGYSLIGPGIASGSLDGIYISGRANVEVKNGTIRDFGMYGINEVDGTNHRVINVRVSNNNYDGMYLKGRAT